MESFIKKVSTEKTDDESHKYFIRFGKGLYERRFLIGYVKSADKVKIKTSFEFANDLVKFVKEIKDVNFSGKVLSKEKIPGKDGRKKAGVFVYEIENGKIEDFAKPYYFLLDVDDPEITMKMKKALPKPGQAAEKIDEGFCSLTIDSKLWPKAKEAFFWDAPEGKKVEISHNMNITEIKIPENEKDPVKMRENAVRRGKMIKTFNVDGVETKKELNFEA